MISVRWLDQDDWMDWRRIGLASLTEAPSAFAEWTGAVDTEDRWRHRLRDVPFNLLGCLDGCAAGMVSATTPAEVEVEVISLWIAQTYPALTSTSPSRPSCTTMSGPWSKARCPDWRVRPPGDIDLHRWRLGHLRWGR
jgi:hypothetical protein